MKIQEFTSWLSQSCPAWKRLVTGYVACGPQLRRTHVQDNEAGGITQQIGATNVPNSAIREQTKFIPSVRFFISLHTSGNIGIFSHKV